MSGMVIMKKQPIREPLAYRMRPRNFDEYVGQEKLTGKNSSLRSMIERGVVPPMMLWGPPGVGKTSLASLISEVAGLPFVTLSAVESGKKMLTEVVREAEELFQKEGTRTILFVDEIHRWNKAQQDALLPYVERGTVILIGATTENPSFEIISPLLSRTRVFILERLESEHIIEIVTRALKDEERGLGKINIKLEPDVLEYIAVVSGGDARVALNALELAYTSRSGAKKKTGEVVITESDIKEALQRTHVIFDKKGEEFYNLISALHKSMRGSDPNASLYWLARMLEGGADPLYIARRVLRFASEDIGMANSEAMIQANAAYDACHKIGMPECSVHLAQAVVYCAKSKKSNALYRAYGLAAEDAKQTSHLGVPIHLRNAPTKLMKDIGYGKEYKYNPDYREPVDQEYLPEELRGRDYFGK